VLLAVRATDWRRQWPLDRWVDAVRRLVTEHRCEIVFCGGQADAAAVAGLVGGLGVAAAHAHDLSAEIPLRDVPALLARMDLYLGVNSGLMHLAAACGTPVVAVFDADDAVAWRPRGEGHAILCGTMRRRVGRWLSGRGAEPVDATWAAGEALREVTVTDVVDRAVAGLAARPAAMRLLDLRAGSHRYEVDVRPAARPASVSVGV
jgi:ADP-heptose:LPS heptosyltransferase